MNPSKTSRRAARITGFLAGIATWTALAGSATSCATHYHTTPRPVSAVLEIRVNGQWVKQQRTVYVYPMDEPYRTLPTVELEALERQAVADGDESRALALRNMLELRKLGIVPEEDK